MTMHILMCQAHPKASMKWFWGVSRTTTRFWTLEDISRTLMCSFTPCTLSTSTTSHCLGYYWHRLRLDYKNRRNPISKKCYVLFLVTVFKNSLTTEKQLLSWRQLQFSRSLILLARIGQKTNSGLGIMQDWTITIHTPRQQLRDSRCQSRCGRIWHVQIQVKKEAQTP